MLATIEQELIKKTSNNILEQVSELLSFISEEEYRKELDILSKNSIGKHVRHIIEFYICLLNGIESGEINYDKRERNIELENNISYARNTLQSVGDLFEGLDTDQVLQLSVSLGVEESTISIATTIARELAYNIEHAIHHMAILKIAITHHFPQAKLPKDFGIAYSTLKYQQQCAH